jgi:uncharacterized protein (DUF2062 family)
MKGRLARAVNALFLLEDSPHRIALAFAIGIWIAFSPLLGIHTGLALGIAFLFRLSRAAMLLGAYVNNPWTIAPMYTAGTLLGSWLLGVSPTGISEIAWDREGDDFYRSLWQGLQPYIGPYFLGNTVLGVLAAIPAYFLLRALLLRRRATVAPAPL